MKLVTFISLVGEYPSEPLPNHQRYSSWYTLWLRHNIFLFNRDESYYSSFWLWDHIYTAEKTPYSRWIDDMWNVVEPNRDNHMSLRRVFSARLYQKYRVSKWVTTVKDCCCWCYSEHYAERWDAWAEQTIRICPSCEAKQEKYTLWSSKEYRAAYLKAEREERQRQEQVYQNEVRLAARRG